VGHSPPRVNLAYDLDIRGVTRKVELPFVTGVLADLSGRPAAPPRRVADRGFVEIDRGNFDARMAAIRPRLAFAVPNALSGHGDLEVELNFASMADFSPAGVARQVPSLRALLEARGKHEEASPARAELDRRLALQLNSILHADDFQRLEATWRGVRYLVTEAPADELLRIKVLDIRKSELARTLTRFKGAGWDQSPIFRMIDRDGYGTSGAAPFGCLVADYAFDHGPGDVEILDGMARICGAAHAPLLAAASPGVMHMDSWQELPVPRDLSKIFQTLEHDAWRALRASENARYLALALPRFLARAPYRPDEVSIDGFPFEEDTGDLDHGRFVWANPAYLMAVNVHWSFKTYGWCTHLSGVQGGGAVEGLPLVTQPDGHGGIATLCPTEIAIDDRREAELAHNGFAALVHRRDSDMAAFLSAPSLGVPESHGDRDEAANARRSVQLPHVFATCRIAHYVKAIVRDRFAASSDTEAVQRWLQDWIATYVDAVPGIPDATQLRKPLAAARVIVEAAPGNPDSLTAKVNIRLND